MSSYGPASGGLSVYKVQATSQGKGCLAPIWILVLMVAILGLFAVLNIAKSGGLSAILGAGGLDSPVVATFGGEGTGAGLFTEPATLAIDDQDNIYVGDGKTGRIQQFEPSGKYVRFMQFTASYNGQIRCMAASPNGTIYACDVTQVPHYNGPTGEQLPGAITIQDNKLV